jgi:phospholipid/cholesterol/gamma-HCH transport system substrate-binding protein
MTTAGTRAAEDIRMVVADTRTLVEGVRAGRGTVGRFLTDDAFYERMTGIGTEAERTVRNLREATDRGRTVVESFTARDGPMQQMLQTLNATAGQAREVVSDLAESTEALKRNFLFRGFFRRRGFYDLNAISREAYAGGALAGDGRTPIRIWIDASVLFEAGSDGVEALTAAGRRRIDSAMADLVRYPRDSPLVVEGYAESVGGEPAFLRAEDRALLVREYILARFRRNATLVGSMSMSDQAAGSPSGDGRWSGVALALFVQNTALAQ